MCDNKELLIGFLYGEIDPVSRQTFERHLATCVECRDELAALGGTREQIALWTPPDLDLGFRIVRGSDAPAPARWRFPFPSWSPAWGVAAAALIVLAIGAAIANLDVRYGSDGLVVRTGWNHDADSRGSTAVDWKAQAEALDRRLQDLEKSVATGSTVQNASTSDMSDAELLQRVRDIVGQSETRQQRVTAARLTELMREVDAQRRLDLATINQGMTRLRNTSGLTNNYLQRLLVRTALESK